MASRAFEAGRSGRRAAVVKCQFCANPATVHLTDIVNKQKRELHLCEDCAKQQHLLSEPKLELNLTAILHLLVGHAVTPVTPEQVKPILDAIADRQTAWTPAELDAIPVD